MREVLKAIVTNNDDPERRGRVKVRCRALVHSDEIDEWIEPVLASSGNKTGVFMVPQAGDPVEIEFSSSSHSDDVRGLSFLANPDWRYRAACWTSMDQVPSEFGGSTYGRRLGIVFRPGQYLVLDVEASNLMLVASKVSIGGPSADQQVPLGTLLHSILTTFAQTLTTWANSHVHPTTSPGSPTGVAATPLDLGTDITGTSWLSDVVYVKK